MTDTFEGNGEYTNYGDGSSDFKRKNQNTKNNEEEMEENSPTAENTKTSEYIRELLGEKVQIDRKYPNADRLIDQEIHKVQATGKVQLKENRYVDIYREKQIRVTVKVLVPIREHPKFNFVGKLLGPKGNSMKRLQEETMCKMAVLGRGSMKDRKKEDDLRAALDPKYAHLNDDLHIEISALAPPAEAHARIAYALAEVRKYLIPDSNDIIRQEQMREMMSDGTIPVPESQDTSASNAIEVRSPPPYKRVAQVPSYTYRPAPTTGPSRSPVSTRTVMPAKQKILSILDRARNAMEESYGVHHYEEAVTYEANKPYEEYAYTHSAPITTRSRYEGPDYESAEYRREYYRESPPYQVKASSSSSTRTSSWKESSDYPSSRGHEEPSNSKHHSHSSRETRYRTSPYPRPTKTS